MFKFDETLFNLSSLYVDDSLDILVTKLEIMDELTTMPNYENYTSVNTVCDNVRDVIEKLVDLHNRILDAKKIMRMVNYDDSLISSFLGYNNIGIGTFSCFLSDVHGEYGCNQSSALSLYKKYMMDPDSLLDYEKQKIENIKAIFENFDYLKSSTDNDYLFLLDFAANSGCGFANNANIVIDLYSNIENGEERFKEKYNIPLYNVSNNIKYYNYEALFMALLLNKSKRNMNYDIRSLFGIDHEDDLHYIPGVTDTQVLLDFCMNSNGFYNSDITGNLVKELSKDFNVNALITNTGGIGMYTENISNYDYCSISASNFSIKPYDDFSKARYGGSMSFRGGHSMTIIGITPNGNFLVSSWGFKFELYSFQTANLNFFKVGEKSVE